MKNMAPMFFFVFLQTISECIICEAAETRPASWYWRQGLESARRGEFDSAFSRMKQAFAKGISDDSLYYLWAEIYLYRNVLDTALALNFSVKPQAGTELKTLALRQRYAIYNVLGWHEQAEAVLDSLGRRPVLRLRGMIPECNLFLSGGGFLEKTAVDRNYPYPRSSDSSAMIGNGAGIASLRIGWGLPIGKTQGVYFGGRLRYAGSRFTAASSAALLDDSADAALGGFVQYSMLSNLLSLKYTCSRKKDFLDAKSFLHEFLLRYAMVDNDFIGSLEAGYRYEFPVKEHYYYFMTYFEREINAKNRIESTVFISGMNAKAYTFDESIPCIYVKDAVIYRDSSFTQPIRTSIGLLQEDSYGRLYGRRVIPQSYWGVNPQLRWQYRLTRAISVGTGGEYLLCRYIEKYSWLDLKYAPENVPANTGIRNIYTGTESFLAMSGADGRYYWVRLIPSVNEVTLDPEPVAFRSLQRVDQYVSLNLFLKCSLGRIGVVMLDITGRRNFSTLMKSAPVDIQKWYVEAMLSWFFRFRPDNRR